MSGLPTIGGVLLMAGLVPGLAHAQTATPWRPGLAIAPYAAVDLPHGEIQPGTGSAYGLSFEYEPSLPGSVEIELGVDRFPGLDARYHGAVAVRQYFALGRFRPFTRWGGGVSVEARSSFLLHLGGGLQVMLIAPLALEMRYAYVTVFTSGIHPKYSSLVAALRFHL